LAFTQNGSVWTGTEFKDIGTFVNQNSATITALAGDDQVTLQSSTDSATALNISLGDGADRIFVTDSQTNTSEFALINSLVLAGDGNDIIFADDAGLIQNFRTPYLQGSTINGLEGNDIIRVYGAISGASFSSVNGNAGADAITLGNELNPARTTALNPDRYDSAQINGGRDNDFIFFELGNTNVVGTSINGNLGNDFFSIRAGEFLSGNWERSTIYGGQGSDTFELGRASSALLVYGDRDDDEINLGTGRDTIYGGQGNDVITDVDGANLIFGDADNDTITTNGADSSTVYGGTGNDVITDNAGRSFLYGEAGGDTIVDGTGSDFIYAGVDADIVRLSADGVQDTVRQLDGESVAATAVSDDRDGFWTAGDVITFANGIDGIRGFTQASDVLDTTLGDLGLEDVVNGADRGRLYNAANGTTRIADGMVSGRSYYMNGTWNGVSAFTIGAGPDSLLITQGNNGPIGTNANVALLRGIDASTLNYTNFI